MAQDTDATDRDTVSVRYEGDGPERPATAIVRAVATATDRSETDLPPLGEVLDTDALNVLVERSTTDGLSLSFAYAGTHVVVVSDGRITVRSSPVEST